MRTSNIKSGVMAQVSIDLAIRVSRARGWLTRTGPFHGNLVWIDFPLMRHKLR